MSQDKVVIETTVNSVQVKVVGRASRKKAIGLIYLPGDWIGAEVYVIKRDVSKEPR